VFKAVIVFKVAIVFKAVIVFKVVSVAWELESKPNLILVSVSVAS